MAAQATFRHGDPLMIDYLPTAGDIAAGDVVPTGAAGPACLIAHRDVANNVLGALAAGGGVYDVVNLNNAANYAKVWWDDAANKITTVSTNNAQFGWVTGGGGGGANSTARVFHWPFS